MGLDMYLIEKNNNGETSEVGYWRKANQIHKWFVDNVQDGNDNCLEYHVPFNKLVDLRNLCASILMTKQSDKLPPQDGFFFGSTEIDEGYFDDLRETIKIIDALNKNGSYYYSSSW